ncbi:MAG: regulator of sirC expression with transglutaminase-like and TPR domain [Pirellulaceae bacterium]|jgi:regulator of sirC expression with transglutaminase-like and TPR domain
MAPIRHCAPLAYDYFRQQIDRLDSTDGLLHAAIAISMHALPNVVPSEVDNQLTQWAQTVRKRVSGPQPQALLAHLHHLLFDELGFAGNTASYYHPLNSYIPSVLESKTGIPITLTLVYKVVAERVGLRVQGISAPGHFLARVEAGDERALVDPFHGGMMLTAAEAQQKMEKIFRRELPSDSDLFPVATHQSWILRVLNNLRAIFAEEGRANDVAALAELAALLQ